MQDLGFTVKKDLASTIRNYLKEKGKNVTEEDINEILQRLANVNNNRPKGASIFLGGHKYFGGSNKDFVVKDGQQIDLSVKEYNEIFDGYLEKEKGFPQIEHTDTKPAELILPKAPKPEPEDIKLSEEALKSIKQQAFKTSLSNMSDKQLLQIAHSNYLTTDTEQLEMIAHELEARGKLTESGNISKIIKIIKAPQESNTKELADNTPVQTKEPDTENTIQAVSNDQEETPDIKQSLPEIKINPPEKEIQKNINNLKQGESYTYLLVKEQNSWGFGQNQKPVTWTRNDDNTLTKMTPDFQIDGDFGALTEKYNADGTQLLSRTKLGGIYLTKGLYTTTEYSDAKPVKETTDLKDIYKTIQEDLPHTTRILGLMSPEARIYQNDKAKNNAIANDNQTFASKELKNSKGETELTYKNGTFIDNKGQEIQFNEAEQIIKRLVENQDLSELVKNYYT